MEEASASQAVGTGIEDLPIELTGIVLLEFLKDDILAQTAVQFVCKKWRELILTQRAYTDTSNQPQKRWRSQWEKKNTLAALTASAALQGHLEMLKWLRKSGCPFDESACASAAQGGHLNVLMWLREAGCPWAECTGFRAAKRGHFILLKWAVAYGCPVNQVTMSMAAKGGHLNLIKFLREDVGCPWNEWTFTYAAGSGNIELMEWLRERGCPLESETFTRACARGQLEAALWLRERGCPIESSACTAAASRGHIGVLRWLCCVCDGPYEPRGLVRAAVFGMNEEVVKWLKEESGWWDEQMDDEVEHILNNHNTNNEKVVKWIKEHLTEE